MKKNNAVKIFKLLLLSIMMIVDGKSIASIQLHGIFGNNMVLQQQSNVALWGTASKNSKVIIVTSWNKKQYTTKADGDGKWTIKVATPMAGGTY